MLKRVGWCFIKACLWMSFIGGQTDPVYGATRDHVGLPGDYSILSRPYADLHVYLVTLGLGDRMDQRFGHTLIHIKDGSSDKDYYLNWGVFKFNQSALWWQFFKGYLYYGVASWPARYVVKRYKDVEQRSFVEHELLLTEAQKEIFIESLKPYFEHKNFTFLYHFFFKNCATIPRDLLDMVWDGKLKERFSKEPAHHTFRDYIRTHLNQSVILWALLELIVNSEVDQPRTAWEEMFYPPMLQFHLGREPGLLGPMQVLSPGKPVAEVVSGDRVSQVFIWLSLSLFLSLLGVLGLCGKSLFWSPLLFIPKTVFLKTALPKTGLRMGGEHMGIHLWGLISLILGASSVFLSVLMLLGWLVSEHTFLAHNAYLWMFWPLDVMFCVYGARVMGCGLRQAAKGVLPLCVYALACLHILGGFLLLGLVCVGSMDQDVTFGITYILPGLQCFWFMHAWALRHRFFYKAETVSVQDLSANGHDLPFSSRVSYNDNTRDVKFLR